jgi:hypothetical protein
MGHCLNELACIYIVEVLIQIEPIGNESVCFRSFISMLLFDMSSFMHARMPVNKL